MAQSRARKWQISDPELAIGVLRCHRGVAPTPDLHLLHRRPLGAASAPGTVTSNLSELRHLTVLSERFHALPLGFRQIHVRSLPECREMTSPFFVRASSLRRFMCATLSTLRTGCMAQSGVRSDHRPGELGKAAATYTISSREHDRASRKGSASKPRQEEFSKQLGYALRKRIGRRFPYQGESVWVKRDGQVSGRVRWKFVQVR